MTLQGFRQDFFLGGVQDIRAEGPPCGGSGGPPPENFEIGDPQRRDSECFECDIEALETALIRSLTLGKSKFHER